MPLTIRLERGNDTDVDAHWIYCNELRAGTLIDKGHETGLERWQLARWLAAAPELLALVRTYHQSRSEAEWLAEEPEIHAAILAALAKAAG